jgi:hypothetical protein
VYRSLGLVELDVLFGAVDGILLGEEEVASEALGHLEVLALDAHAGHVGGEHDLDVLVLHRLVRPLRARRLLGLGLRSWRCLLRGVGSAAQHRPSELGDGGARDVRCEIFVEAAI